LSIGLQGVVHWKLKSQIAFRQLSFQQGQIVLDDVLLLSCANKSTSFHVRAKKIRFSILSFQKPFHLHIAFEEPHLFILDKAVSNVRRLVDNRSRWLCFSVSAENGSFECKDGQGDPFAGRFSLDNDKLQLEIDDGSMSAQLISNGRDRTIDCSFVQMPSSWLSHRFVSGVCQGRISGALFINLERSRVRSASGRLIWENAAFSSKKWQGDVGAQKIEWEGELTLARRDSINWLDAILSFPDRMKVKFHRGFLSRGQSFFEDLEGMFSSNHGVGLRWEVSGPSFSWEGKGFSKSRSINWLESRLSIHESTLFLRAEQLDSLHSKSLLELQQADPFLVRLVSECWPVPWPFCFDSGVVSARLIWQEMNGSLESWSVEQLVAKELAIHGDDWSFQCRRADAVMDHRGNAVLSIDDSSSRWRNIAVSSLTAHGRLVDQTISEASFSGSVNGLSAQGVLQGTLKEFFVRANHFSGEESIEARANLTLTGRQIDLSNAHLEARHLDLSCMQSFFSIDCKGSADLILNYANGELKLDGVGSSLKLNSEAGIFAIDQLGCTEPFEPGVRAVWEKATREWTVQTIKTHCDCTTHGRKIAVEGQLEIGRQRGQNIAA